jgi:uncharacterized membrane protein (UPF0136 family)
MTWPKVVLAVYGVINVVGGMMGYATAQSMQSLIAGVSFGVLFIALYVLAGQRPLVSYVLGIVLTMILGAFWIYRLGKLQEEGKSVTMAMGNAGLAVLVILLLIIALFASRPRAA